MIHIEYDDQKVLKEDIVILSEAIQHIVSEVTEIEDVFVYANSSQIKIKVAPIEIFIQMTAKKIKDENVLTDTIKSELVAWKQKNSFSHPINLTLIPMEWKVEIGI